MYLSYWGLAMRPFHPTPDPRFLYRSPQHEEALSRLNYTISSNLGAAVLTGVFGCGKTLVIHTLLRSLPSERYRVALITQPHLGYVELLLMIAQGLGAEHLPQQRGDVLANLVLSQIGKILADNAKEGKETVVIIDEAHTIDDPATMDSLRLLLNFQTDERFLLTLLLCGQPELGRKISELRPFEQRVSIKWHLDPFSATETAAYLHHRVTVAGAMRRIFTDDALALIHQASGGVARRINRLADLCLLSAMGSEAKVINKAIVEEEVAGLGDKLQTAGSAEPSR